MPHHGEPDIIFASPGNSFPGRHYSDSQRSARRPAHKTQTPMTIQMVKSLSFWLARTLLGRAARLLFRPNQFLRCAQLGHVVNAAS